MATCDAPLIQEIPPVPTGADLACLIEVRDVLSRHGMLERFGVIVNHRHFDMAPDEVLIEFVDTAERSELVRPVPLGQIDMSDLQPVAWLLSPGGDPLGEPLLHWFRPYHDT